jgi:hypothetical protein
MKRKGYLVVYGAVGAALLLALIAAPGVWATPGQSGHAQTVPTRTPVPPPIVVTDPPGANTPIPPAPNTPQPGTTAVPTVTPRVTGTAVAPPRRANLGSAPLELPVTGGCARP